VIAEDPKTGQQRISLTFSVINNARRVTFLVTGHEKAAVVQNILSKNPVSSNYPAAKVLPADGLLDWYLDEAAAHKLKIVPEAGIEPAQK
jgi:6-phosphogluconolactonase